MKKTLRVLILSTLMITSHTVFAYSKKLKAVIYPEFSTDTIYYFADTSNVPKKDRLFTVENSYLSKDFYIYCSCMNTEQGYIYLTGADRRSFVINKTKFKALKLSSLADLISIVKTYNSRDFAGQYVIYIVLPQTKGKYILYPAINRSNGIIQRSQ